MTAISHQVAMSNIYIGGIEGGASSSTVVLFDGNGHILCEVAGPSLNHWTIGMEECQKRINDLVMLAKAQAGIPPQTPLESLGLSLSGCEQEATNNELKQGLEKKYKLLSLAYLVSSDTVAPIAAVSEEGGMVQISGTGSNTLLKNPDGTVFQCGGWGHFLGDEGSAYWISYKAIKIIYDDQDEFVRAPANINFVWKSIQSYFKISSRLDILPHFYGNFDKQSVAGLCKELAVGAAKGDELCLWLFKEAGSILARFIIALGKKANKSLVEKDQGLVVVCVGSVWKSWKFLENGFRNEMDSNPLAVPKLTLVKLTVQVATGAAYLAAKLINFNLPRTYEDNYCVLYEYRKRKDSTR